MRLLLDTQVVYLWTVADAALPQRVAAALSDARNHASISAASFWELAIKRAKGKLAWPPDGFDVLLDSSFGSLPITPRHAIAAGQLPPHHADPFDRILVAQAIAEDLTLVGGDPIFRSYGLSVLWD
ncbi:MAG: type II toxin-antitoxin system VapC family toxin [Actinomycetota bacterium]|nr:type II toxin-antitoxin system VapC family toxin [Actinomycetota bacterium]